MFTEFADDAALMEGSQQKQVLRINEPLDVKSVRIMERQLQQMIQSQVPLIELDMRDMPYMTAIGAMLLVNVCVHLQKGQEVRFVYPNERVRTLLETIGLDHYIYD